MFVVISQRVIKVGTGQTAKFAPRTTNQVTSHISGPFGSRRTAERAALQSLSTHTCLDARVCDATELRRLIALSDCEYVLQRTARTALAMLDARA